ncbi:MAG: LysM domain-containing protein [Candidatus Binataceae bacterium]
MFFPGSRYANTGIYTLTRANGAVVSVARLPQPQTNPVIGFYRRQLAQRLDLIASHYLFDATTFWRLCDANDAIVPDSLAAKDLIGIPSRGT